MGLLSVRAAALRPTALRGAAAAAITALLAPLAVALQAPTEPTLSPPSNVATPNVAATEPSVDQGVSPRSPEKSDIQQLLADTVDAALSRGEMSTMVSHLSKANQDEIGDVRDKQWPALDGRIETFRQEWRAKFGIEFKLADKQSVVFADDSFPIRPGDEASENATGNVKAGAPVASSMPTSMPATMPMDQNPMGSGAALQGNTQEPSSGAMPSGGQPSAFPNVPPAGSGGGVGAIGSTDPSRTEALMVRSGTVTLPQTSTAAARDLRLVNEGQVVPQWHIQLPPGITAQRLHDSLLQRLTKLDDNADSWPTEINQAYQAVSREILAALVDAGATTQP